MIEKYKEVEKSLIKTYRKTIWRQFVKGVADYNMIQENDHIMVCMSGGKDSFLLAKCIQELQRHWNVPFQARYVVMNPGYNERNLEQIKYNAKLLNIPIEIFETNIFDVTERQAADNPCFLCARMRRGALYSQAQRLGCNKIALGHHFNDMIETTLLSMFFGGELKTMMPKLHSDNFEGIDLIRPMCLIKEEAILRWRDHHELVFINCACKFTEKAAEDSHTSKRKVVKDWIAEMKEENPFIDTNIYHALEHVNLSCVLGYKNDDFERTFLDDFDGKEWTFNKEDKE